MDATKSEWRQGGLIPLVGAAIGMSVGFSALNQVASLFIVPMETELGWSRATLSIAPILVLVYSVGVPFAGILVERFGAARIAVIGLLLTALGEFALAAMPNSRIAFVGIAVYLGLVGGLSYIVPFAKGLVGWFSRARGTAFGVMLCTASLFSAVIIPVLQLLIAEHGWRAGYVALGLAACVGAIVTGLLFRARPQAATSQVAETETIPVTGAWRDARFLVLMAALAFVAAPISAIASQLQPILRDRGWSSESAALAGSVYFVSVTIGRLGGGMLLDKFKPTSVAAVLFAAGGVGSTLLLLEPAGMPAMIVAIMCVGLSHGAETDVAAYMVARLFPPHYYSPLLAISGTAIGIASTVGGFASPMVKDAFGSYGFALAGASISFAIAGILIYFLGTGRLGRVDAQASFVTPGLDPAR